MTGEPGFRDVAAGFVGPFLEDGGLGEDGSPSAFNGLTAHVVALDAVASIVSSDHLRRLQRRQLDRVAAIILSADGEPVLDYIGGIAGALPVLVAADGGSGRYEDAIRVGSDLLLDADPRSDAEHLAHGENGVLLGLAHAVGYNSRIRATGIRDRLVGTIGEIETRMSTYEAHRAAAWCKGVPGVLAAAAEGLGVLGTSPSELDSLMGDAARRFYGGDSALSGSDASLCHGTGGVVSTWVTIGQLLDRADMISSAGTAASALILRYLERGFTGGIRSGEASLGYMLGISGFAHALLHVASPLPAPDRPAGLALTGPVGG